MTNVGGRESSPLPYNKNANRQGGKKGEEEEEQRTMMIIQDRGGKENTGRGEERDQEYLHV